MLKIWKSLLKVGGIAVEMTQAGLRVGISEFEV